MGEAGGDDGKDWSRLGLKRALPTVPHSHDRDALAIDPIPDDVRTNESQLSHPRFRNEPSAIGKFYQAFRRLHNSLGHRAGSLRIESTDVSPDLLDISHGGKSPYNSRHFGFCTGHGNSLSVPHDFSHSMTAS